MCELPHIRPKQTPRRANAIPRSMTAMLPALLRFNSVYQRATFNGLLRSPPLNVGAAMSEVRMLSLAAAIAALVSYYSVGREELLSH
jgi:hypothetical protein